MDASIRRCCSAAGRNVGTDMKPKKLILSRKGFDSGSGGCPSPIFPDGTMFSLPIPSGDRERFDDLQHGTVDIASVVDGITGGHLTARDRAHLDPDLNFDTYRHRKNRAAWQQWRGMLGQTGIAQRHLDKQAIGAGDVFLSSASTAVLSKLPKAGASSEAPQSCTCCGAGSKSTRITGSLTSGQMTSARHATIRTSSEATAATGTPLGRPPAYSTGVSCADLGTHGHAGILTALGPAREGAHRCSAHLPTQPAPGAGSHGR